jgi:hypothetical protein
MQVKIKLGREWWLMPIKGEFTKKELEPYFRVPYLAPLEMGEAVKFFGLQKKSLAKKWLGMIEKAYSEGYKPVRNKVGGISFKKIKKESQNARS